MERKEPWWKKLIFIPVFLLLYAMNYFIGLIDYPSTVKQETEYQYYRGDRGYSLTADI